MSPFRQLIHGRVDRGDHRLLKDEAAARGISMSRCVGDVIREYFALRQEMLSVIKSPEVPGDGHPGLVHSLVARMAEQLGVTADARADELIEGQCRIEYMLDRLVMLYLLHTPEVAPQLQDWAVASANRRYRNYRDAVRDLLVVASKDARDTENARPESVEASAL